MIYLLTQMVLALLVAAVMGAALGWLLHRTTQTQTSTRLRTALQRQRQQLSQLNAEVQMLTDDYDELQRQSHDEIGQLREANQQIPRLNANLEKSQTLVSQMIKRHESQVLDLNKQITTLTSRLQELEEREQSLKRQQAALDYARREMGLTDAPSSENDASEATVTETPTGVIASSRDTDSSSSPVNNEEGNEAIASESAPDDAVSAAGATVEPAPDDAVSAAAAAAESTAESAEDNAAMVASAASGDADDTTSIDAAAAVEETGSEPAADDSAVADAPSARRISNARNAGSWASARVEDAEPMVPSVIHLDAEAPPKGSASASAAPSAGSSATSVMASRTQAGTVDATPGVTRIDKGPVSKRSDAPDEDVDPFDQVMEVDEQMLSEITVDDGTSSFEPVDQRDDLKQIVGIGPQTEKALNDLGITSYAQLARLKHHEIETIASALQVGPDRIEKDDWVGNARRQLEDVLEDL